MYYTAVHLCTPTRLLLLQGLRAWSSSVSNYYLHYLGTGGP